MRWLFLVALLVLPTVFAATCTDGDNPAKGSKFTDFMLENASRVYYGITPKDDVCVTAPEGVSAAESLFLREYYCTEGNDTQRKYEDVDCVKQGYTGCKAGGCYGKKSSSSSSNATSAPVIDCGNKIVDKSKGEQCDPPGDICFGSGGAYGQCTSSCLCELASAFKNKCGNGVLESGEVCESDSDCASGKCVSCACTGSATTVNTTTTTTTTTTNTSVETVVPEPVVEESDVVSLNESFVQVEDIAVENFSDSAGIKATGALSRFFTGLWSWFAGLFS